LKFNLSDYWSHNLSPFLYQFPEPYSNWGPGGIRWYGISYLCGFVVAGIILRIAWKRGRSPYDQEQVMNLMTFQILGVLLGGRIGYALLYQGNKLLEDPFIILRVWEGGMASHGGFIGVFIATIWYAKQSKQSPLPIGDIIVSVVPPGLFFGRVANFINGELWGKTTDVSWGVLFPKAPGFLLGVARHPSQIYAATLEGLIPFIYVQWRFWKTNITNRCPGQLTGEFLFIYSIGRITNEIFREPDASLILSMSRGQFYSIFLAIGGILLILLARQKASKQI